MAGATDHHMGSGNLEVDMVTVIATMARQSANERDRAHGGRVPVAEARDRVAPGVIRAARDSGQLAGGGQSSRLSSRGLHRVVGRDPSHRMGSITTSRSTSAWDIAAGQDGDWDARVLIIDDYVLSRENLAALVAETGGLNPSVAWDLRSLIRELEDPRPTVILLNIDTRDSVKLLRTALELNPSLRAIVLGVSADDEPQIVACAEAGVAGYHMRSDSLEDLLVMIGRVTAGESACSPEVLKILLGRLSTRAVQDRRQPGELVLTRREAQILGMLELGMSNRDISLQLCIAVHTVKNHVHRVLTKLGVNTRAEAAALSRTTKFVVRAPRN